MGWCSEGPALSSALTLRDSEPAGHMLQAVAPAASEYRGGVHDRQAVTEVLGAYIPAGHVEHTLAFAGEY